jgi:hypothetical protein
MITDAKAGGTIEPATFFDAVDGKSQNEKNTPDAKCSCRLLWVQSKVGVAIIFDTRHL